MSGSGLFAILIASVNMEWGCDFPDNNGGRLDGYLWGVVMFM